MVKCIDCKQDKQMNEIVEYKFGFVCFKCIEKCFLEDDLDEI